MAIAGWLVAAGLSLHAAPARAEVQVSDQARELFRAGVKHLKANPPDYQAAYEAFRDAYADSPSPKILGNLGLAAAKLERDGEALDAYARYLEEAGAKSRAERFAIDKDMKQLRARVAYIRLAGLPEGAQLLDRRLDGGAAVENRYALDASSITLGLRAGRHELTIEAEGYAPKTLTLEFSPGDEEARAVTMEALTVDAPDDELAPGPSPEPTTPDDAPDEAGADPGAIGMWVAIGTTAALGVATGVVGGLAASNFSSFEEARDSGDAARAADLQSKGETLNLTADVLLGVTGAAAAASVVLIVLEMTGDDASEGDTALRVSPLVTPRGGFVGLGGSF